MARPVIFTVDDESQVLAAVERDLRKQYRKSYRIMKAGSGAEALKAMQELKGRGTAVALVLADQRMPAMSGTELLTEAQKLFPDAKKVLLTAYADTEAAIQSINEIGLDYYLMKPWDPPEQQLYPVLDDLLDDWQANVRPEFDGIRVAGTTWSPPCHDAKDFLARNQVPYQWLDVERDSGAQALVEGAQGDDHRLPVVFFPDGEVLIAPDNRTLAEKVGLQTEAAEATYDLVVIGAGPAGLAASVYGGSEGLRTVTIEKAGPGGQAGTSSFIENYLGFPKGLSGADLARRATTQAKRFGVEILSTREVVGLRVEEPYRIVKLADGTEIPAKAVVIATGMTTRKLDKPGVEPLVGRGIYYGASLAEAAAHRGSDMFVIGGANSAGQGALFFSRHATRVRMLIRGDSLQKSMSHYLIEQISQIDNIELLTHTELAEAHGEERLEAVTLVNNKTGEKQRFDAGAVFVFIGAMPHTELAAGVVERDAAGFILTGPDLKKDGKRPKGWHLDRDPFVLETSVPGIFAAGDARAGSTKRVATSVGEGSNSIALVHQYLRTV